MEITEKKVKISELFEDYFNDDEEGVVGYNNRLNIRPKYQREFVYSDDKKAEVIRTVKKGFPLNTFYWSLSGEDQYELLDGQQRTIAICEYLDGNYSVDGFLFGNLPADIQQAIKDYEIYVYVCDGPESEKLEWFKIINIAGVELTDQELRNAVYADTWTQDAKRYFSKTGCAAYQLAKDYVTGTPIRQDYLETALDWISQRDGITIEEYMAQHMHDPNALPLWQYFRDVIEWVQDIFPVVRREMKGRPWGLWYNQHHDRTDLDPAVLETKIQALLSDAYEVTKPSGIYEYLLTGDERCLQLRQFDIRDRRAAYERQEHKCAICGQEFEFEEMHGDHIIPWSRGGKTVPENCQMLCTVCNIAKSNQ